MSTSLTSTRSALRRMFQLSTVLIVTLATITTAIVAPLLHLDSAAAAAAYGDNDYPWKSSDMTQLSPLRFAFRNCTDFVAWRLNEAKGGNANDLSKFNWSILTRNGAGDGNAISWKGDAIALGVPVNNTPAIGAVAWWNGTTPNPYGHVAIVVAINTSNNTVTIEEYNSPAGSGTYLNTRSGLTADAYLHIADAGGANQAQGSSWRSFESLGTGLTAGPTVSTWGPGRLDVFWVGADTHLWHRWFSNGWQATENLGGHLKGVPAAVTAWAGRIDIFAQGTDNTLQHIWVDSVWHPWESLATGLTSGVAATTWGPGRIDIFWVGNDYTLWHHWLGNNAWAGYESLGGNLKNTPTAVVAFGGNRIDIFAKGADNTLQHIWVDSAWHHWESLATGLSAGPAASTWGSGRIDIFWVGMDKTLWHHWLDNNQWQGFESLGGSLQGVPAAVSWGPQRIDVFTQGVDNSLQHKWFG